MNKFMFLLILFGACGHQVAIADDSQRIKQMEGEMKSLKSIASDQDEKIHSLEERVTSTEASFSKTNSSPANAGRVTPDESEAQKMGRSKDDNDQKYID